jgi:hypothetical protein
MVGGLTPPPPCTVGPCVLSHTHPLPPSTVAITTIQEFLLRAAQPYQHTSLCQGERKQGTKYQRLETMCVCVGGGEAHAAIL